MSKPTECEKCGMSLTNGGGYKPKNLRQVKPKRGIKEIRTHSSLGATTITIINKDRSVLAHKSFPRLKDAHTYAVNSGYARWGRKIEKVVYCNFCYHGNFYGTEKTKSAQETATNNYKKMSKEEREEFLRTLREMVGS